MQPRHPALLLLTRLLPLGSSSPAQADSSAAGGRCSLARGSWCAGFQQQEAVARRAPPRGDKLCPGDCGGVGNCNADSGSCVCPAGWGGDDCMTPDKRVCYNMGPDKRDKAPTTDPFWTWSRCSGACRV